LRHLAGDGLGLLKESPRRSLVDQHRRPDQQHHHVRAKLVGGVVAVAGTKALGDRLGHLACRAGGLGHDDRRLGTDGAGPALELPEADQLVDHQEGDPEHEQPRHRVSSERVAGPPPAHRLVGSLEYHQQAGEKCGDDRGGPSLPT
jgi:hypothetical protein